MSEKSPWDKMIGSKPDHRAVSAEELRLKQRGELAANKAKKAHRTSVRVGKTDPRKVVTPELVGRPVIRPKSEHELSPSTQAGATNMQSKRKQRPTPANPTPPPVPAISQRPAQEQNSLVSTGVLEDEAPTERPSPAPSLVVNEAVEPVLQLPKGHQVEEPEMIVSFQVAGLRQRLSVFMVDGLVGLVLLQGLLSFGLVSLHGGHLGHLFSVDSLAHTWRDGQLIPLAVTGSLISALMYFALSATVGRSLGELIFGLQLIDRDSGERPNLQHIAKRCLGGVVSFCTFLAGYFWVLVDPEFRTWHDQLSRTVLVQFRPGTSISDPSMTTGDLPRVK